MSTSLLRNYQVLRRGASTSYSRNFAVLPDGALPGEWYAPTWAISSGVLVNTPTLGTELLTDGGMENWASATNLTNWSEFLGGGTTTINREASVIRSGVYAARCDIDASNNKASIYTAVGNLTAFHHFSCWSRVSTAGKTVGFEYGATASPAFSVSASAFEQINWTTRATINTNAALVSKSCASASCYFDDASVKQVSMSSAFASVNARLSNINLIAPPISTLTTGTIAGIVLCLDSTTAPANFVIAYCDGAGNVKTEKCVAGTYTTLNTTAAAYGATKYFSAKKNGNDISIYYGTTNYGTLITTQTVADAGITSNTIHGLFSTYSGNQFNGTFSYAPYS